MKTTVIFVTIILLVLLGFMLFGKKTEAPISEEVTQDLSQISSEISLEDLKNGTYLINKEKSIINWTGRKKILTNWVDNGIVKIQEGKIILNDQQISGTEFIIDMQTINAETTATNSDQDKLSTHLKSVDFFDVEKYPQAKFVAKEILKTEKRNQFKITGELTIKEKTNLINFDTYLFNEEGEYKIIGQTTLDRTLWDIKFGSDKFFDNLGDNVIDDNVDIEFILFVTKQNEATN